jgi:hypothetical protein
MIRYDEGLDSEEIASYENKHDITPNAPVRVKHKKTPLSKKLKPHYACHYDEDGTKVETWAKKDNMGEVIAYIRQLTNPFGEKLPKETIENIPNAYKVRYGIDTGE